MTVDNRISYVALGDSLAVGQNPYGQISYGYTDYVADYIKGKGKLGFYTKKFAISGYRITDLINDINQNKVVKIDNKKLTIKNALIKADVITLSIGTNELFYKLGINNMDIAYYNEQNLKKYVDEVAIDMEKLVNLVRKYCKEDIILIGFYNPLWHMRKNYAKDLDYVFIYANKKLKQISKKYDMYYIDIHKLFEQNNEYLPNPLDINPSNEGYSAIARKINDIIDNKVLK
jgi:lysophospholipase L1-like esterase